jgi:ribosomal protein S18 acetylase RimI-like enzyme
MKLITKQFSKSLINDYLDFFDNRAFTDNNPNGPCYCTFPYQTEEEFEAMVSQFKDHDVKETIRKVAVEMLEADRIHGYLIYDDKLAIGWCNAANMESYVGFVPPFARKAAIGKTLSIVCLEIAPEYRNKGVAWHW